MFHFSAFIIIIRFIDILKILSVLELAGSQQDKNNASFNIECEGRTYQLQAYDEAEMRRLINNSL